MGDRRTLVDVAAQSGLNLGGDAVGRLLDYAELLRTVGTQIGTVARADAERVVGRHVADSLRAAAVPTGDDREVADLGSGAGLPGIPVAIARPELTVWLLESRARRVAFLELACERLGITNARPLPARVEDAPVGPVDVCFARAFAPLPRSWDLARPLLRAGGRLVYFAGGRADLAVAESLDATVRIVGRPAVATAGPLVIIGQP
jgi:16S rRNA (guanine527-N7)-methyltransferase